MQDGLVGKHSGRSIEQFHAIVPREDTSLLPLLRARNVQIRVATEEQPFAVKLLLALTPWLLILGAWAWLSRRARQMMASGGGPLGGILKMRSRRFEKSTSVSVTFEDVAGLRSAKQDLQEIVQFLKEPERFRLLGTSAAAGGEPPAVPAAAASGLR